MSKLLDTKYAKLKLEYEQSGKDTSRLTALREENYAKHVAKWVEKYERTIEHIQYISLDHEVSHAPALAILHTTATVTTNTTTATATATATRTAIASSPPLVTYYRHGG